jgi:hypothetical protein
MTIKTWTTIIVLLTLLAPPNAINIADIRYGVAPFFQLDDPFQPEDDNCVLTSQTVRAELLATVLLPSIGPHFEYQQQQRPDGTWLLTVTKGIKVGLSAILGGHIGLGAFAEGLALGLSAGISGDLAESYILASDQQANYIINRSADDVAATAIPGASSIFSLVDSFITPPSIANAPQLPPVYESEIYISGDIGAKLEQDFPSIARAAVEIKGLTSAALSFNHESADITLKIGLGVEGNAAGALLVAGIGAEGSGEYLMSITMDKNYNPKFLGIEANGSYDLALTEQIDEGILPLAGRIKQILSHIGASASQSRGRSVAFSAELNIDGTERPENLAATIVLVGLLTKLAENAATVLGGANNYDQQVQAAALDLMNKFANDGKISVQVYSNSAADATASIKFGIGLGLGFALEGELRAESAILDAAFYHNPSEITTYNFKTWQKCTLQR